MIYTCVNVPLQQYNPTTRHKTNDKISTTLRNDSQFHNLSFYITMYRPNNPLHCFCKHSLVSFATTNIIFL